MRWQSPACAPDPWPLQKVHCLAKSFLDQFDELKKTGICVSPHLQHSQHSGKLEQELLNCQRELLVAQTRWAGRRGSDGLESGQVSRQHWSSCMVARAFLAAPAQRAAPLLAAHAVRSPMAGAGEAAAGCPGYQAGGHLLQGGRA
jgi:hypothetical protein